MIMYIARVKPGFKQDLEGGRVTLYGHGVLSGQTGVREMMPTFQCYSQPPKQPNIHGQLRPTRGTPGYKENTLTLPKELTLVCETDKEKTQKAVTAAIDKMLEAVYEGKEIAAVSAMHTKNKCGEPHLNVHLLVGKFGQRRDNGKWGSLNYAGFYDDGNAKDAPKIRKFWTEFITLELQKEFDIAVSFDEKGKCLVTTKEHVPLDSLTKAGTSSAGTALLRCSQNTRTHTTRSKNGSRR